MKRLLALLAVTAGLIAAPALAAGGNTVDQLLQRLAGVTGLQGHFDQRQYGDDGTLLGVSSGVFRLLRPAYFSWEIQSPDSQLIVANAQYLWHYDRDLQTVTRRPVAGNVEASPLQILAGDESVLREQFSVEQPGDNTFILVPNGDGHGFRRLQVSFDGNTITGMDIEDRLNQRVVVVFRDLDPDTPLSAADFDFAPPDSGDVDLFYYDE